MRGKRAKQYRKLMHQYQLTFNFREPYQVLVDAQIVQEAKHYSMDLVQGLERTLQGKVKPMITQCCMRHLYETNPKDNAAIERAKAYERRRCNHHTLEKPLSALDCISEVVDPKASKTNKHRYCVASQDPKVRAAMRQIPGVPLVYINRSVMILEPMAGATEEVREKEEKSKFRAGLKSRPPASNGVKRKREEGEEDEAVGESVPPPGVEGVNAQPIEKRKRKGPKGPNPLSVKKPKKRTPPPQPKATSNSKSKSEHGESEPKAEAPSANGEQQEPSKKKRKRKHKTAGQQAESGQATEQSGET